MLARRIDAFAYALKRNGSTFVTFWGSGVEAGDSIVIKTKTGGEEWRSVVPIREKQIINIPGRGQQLVTTKVKRTRKVAFQQGPGVDGQGGDPGQDGGDGGQSDPQMQQGDPEGSEVETTVEDGSGGSGSSPPVDGYAVIDPE